MEQNELIEIRLECLRYAIEYGSARDVLEPHLLADKYFEWVMRVAMKNVLLAVGKTTAPQALKKLGASARVAHRH